jgi:hypothetical protein
MNAHEYEALISHVARKLTNDTQLIHSGVIEYGKANRWVGKAGFYHQIDVSLENDKSVVLIECKHWGKKLSVEAFLTMWARVIDIDRGERANEREVRGVLATSKGFQAGVRALTECYSMQMSLFVVRSVDDLIVELHRHFVRPSSIKSEEQFGTPTIITRAPLRVIT